MDDPTTFRLPVELLIQLDECCSTSNTTRSDFVRHAIQERLDKLTTNHNAGHVNDDNFADELPKSFEEEVERAAQKGWSPEILKIFNKRRPTF